jgi:hypothetical protein
VNESCDAHLFSILIFDRSSNSVQNVMLNVVYTKPLKSLPVLLERCSVPIILSKRKCH